ncbi:hypothetical protein [Streptomyces sp. NPDC048527]|uniref:hypothetical protein n=1 Tax=Streptomyces sp. NPDC048527 TaxID=3365568 RepID=UPI0037232150
MHTHGTSGTDPCPGREADRVSGREAEPGGGRVRAILHGPSGGAVVAVLAVLGALIWSNSKPASYEGFWETQLEVGLGALHVGWSL